LAAGGIFTDIGILLSVSISIDFFILGYCDLLISQAANAVGASRGALIDLFELIKNVFRLLVVYIEVPPTSGITVAIVKFMVAVPSIFSVVKKEINLSRTSESIPGN